MTVASSSSIARAPRPSSLADVLDLILDKGLVIDAYVRVSAVGIELLTIDARIVVASVDTYLHYAEAVNRLDLTETETRGLTGLFGEDQGDQGDEDGQRDREQSGSRSGGGRREVSSGRGDDREDNRGVRGVASRLADRGRWES